MGELTVILGFTLAALWIIFRRPGSREPWHRERRTRAREESDAANDVDGELLEKLARLEERVKVLERIVTDDPHDLRRQFRDLGG